MKLYFLQLHIHISKIALILLLVFSKFTKIIKLNPTAEILFQPNIGNKMQVLSYNSRVLTTQQAKFSNNDRELRGKTFVLPQYDIVIIDSKFPIAVFTDHNLFSLYS